MALGALLAVLTGIAYNLGAALQKREAVELPVGTKHLMRKLIKRKVWLAATALSTFAWGGQVAALALAPVALVVPLLATGSAVLVVLGVRFLHERFRKPELIGVALVAIGAAAAWSCARGATGRRVYRRRRRFLLAHVGSRRLSTSRSCVGRSASSGSPSVRPCLASKLEPTVAQARPAGRTTAPMPCGYRSW